MKSTRPYAHTKKFYDEQYKKYKVEVKKIGGFVLKKNAFEAAYKELQGESKTVLKDLVYGSKYGTNYKTALAEYRALKSVGIKTSLESLKLSTTQEFADTYASQLAAGYSELKSKGITGKDAALIISQQWFGSK